MSDVNSGGIKVAKIKVKQDLPGKRLGFKTSSDE
jgi:hypothetical protein